ncbi:hypothetical protein [Trichoplusia ni ascovirus 2c]|uniref:Uncharacterized protein ORF149 n=1 Tax=Trichoplusia ni ascovirus 2c TaxID=328615 RepID=Y149_TNAVC|nr:hypothetical protein TNAV2c_gp149 [Trichoplusia ni ascovirus 2c]Q06VD4.1 RecName: Full=Uncharacterized protein ORF149 [Trichoplusia ni ascovirus 2c]ABF70665.1 hypothetical protein [Trichoplusia ni ascovirus 2c]AUS94256.1 hypothetical protein [Trichoplusia ni ascovirus 6b]
MSVLNTKINTSPRAYMLVKERGPFVIDVTVTPNTNFPYSYAITNTMSINLDSSYSDKNISWKSESGNTRITITGSVNSTESYLFLIKSDIEQNVTINIKNRNSSTTTTTNASSSDSSMYNTTRSTQRRVTYDDDDDEYDDKNYFGWSSSNGISDNITTSKFSEIFKKFSLLQWVLVAALAFFMYYFLWKKNRRGSDDYTTGSVYDMPLIDTPIRDSYRLPQSFKRDALYRTSI